MLNRVNAPPPGASLVRNPQSRTRPAVLRRAQKWVWQATVQLVATPQYTPWAHKAHGGPKHRYVRELSPGGVWGCSWLRGLTLSPRYCYPGVMTPGTACLLACCCWETPNTPWAGLPVPPRPVRPVPYRRWPPLGLAGDSEHPLGRTPRPPQAGAPGSLQKMAPPWPGRRLRTPPGQDSLSPPGRCARFPEEDDHPLAWQETPNTP